MSWGEGYIKTLLEENDHELLVQLAQTGMNDRKHAIIELVIEYKLLTRITEATKELQAATEQVEHTTGLVHREVSLLTASSEKLESLTVRLNRLTIALIVITVFAALMPVGIDVWKAHHPMEVPSSKTVQPVPQNATQSPLPHVP